MQFTSPWQDYKFPEGRAFATHFICIPQEAYSMLNILLTTQLISVEVNYFLYGFFDKGLWQGNIFTQDQSRNYSQEGLPARCRKTGYL